MSGDVIFTTALALFALYGMYRFARKNPKVSVALAVVALFFRYDQSNGMLFNLARWIIFTGMLMLASWAPLKFFELFLWRRSGGTERRLNDGGKDRTIYFEDGELAVDSANREIRVGGRWYPASSIRSFDLPGNHGKKTTIFLDNAEVPIIHYAGWFRLQHERLAEALKIVT